MKKSSWSFLVSSVQVGRTERLGRQRGPEPVHVLVRQQRVIEHTCQVRHSRKWRQLRADAFQQLLHFRLVADIGGEGVNAALVALDDVLDNPLRIRIGRAPTGQHDVTGAELGQIRRRVQTDRTETTGDQIAPITARRSGFGIWQTILPMCRACCMRRNAVLASASG